LESYRKWCERHRYRFTKRNGLKIYAAALDQVPTLPCDSDTKLLISEIARQLTSISSAVETYRSKLNVLASTLPEYDCAGEPPVAKATATLTLSAATRRPVLSLWLRLATR
jgi:hypothetical protein